MSDIVDRLRERPSRYASETEEQAKERRQQEREEAAARIEKLEAALRGIKWLSADKDNMEFAATITYSQMDVIRAALAAPSGALEERT